MPEPPNENANAEAEWLSESARHRLLTVRERRVALRVLGERTAPIGIDELAREIAARKTGTGVVDDTSVERVAVLLHHNHLPKMADTGVLDYDRGTNRVEPHRKRIDALCG